MNEAGELRVVGLAGLPLFTVDSDLVEITLSALRLMGIELVTSDVLVYAQKIVSKVEGRSVDLRSIQPSARALELASVVDKDARVVELIISESSEVLRASRGVLIVVHKLGFVMANAGIDASNVGKPSDDLVTLLPIDPDGTAQKLRDALHFATGTKVGVIINDSFGRAWRKGTVGTALGAAGIPALLDQRGRLDLNGRQLRTTEIGYADEIAAAASILMGQADEGRPIVLVRGLNRSPREGCAAELLRPQAEDLFR